MTRGRGGGGVIFLPSPGDDLLRTFALLGRGLRDVVNPNFEQQQRLEEELILNPELRRRLAEAQSAGVAAEHRGLPGLEDLPEEVSGPEEAAEAAARQASQLPGEDERVNVLEGVFDREGAMRLLGGAPPPTATQRLEERTAEAALETGLPEAQAEAGVAEAKAITTESQFNREKYQELIDQGVAPLQARAQTAVLSTKIGDAEFQNQMRDFTERQFQALPEHEQRIFAFASQNPAYLQDIQQRRRLRMQELLAQMRQETASAELLKDKVALITKITDAQSKIEDTLRSEDVPDDQKRLLASRWMMMNSLGSIVMPNNPEFSARWENTLGPGGEVKWKLPESLKPKAAIEILADKVHSGELSRQDLMRGVEIEGVGTINIRDFSPERRQQLLEAIQNRNRPFVERVERWGSNTLVPFVDLISPGVGGTEARSEAIRAFGQKVSGAWDWLFTPELSEEELEGIEETVTGGSNE